MHPSNAFSLHDNSSTSPPPQDSSSTRRSTRHSKASPAPTMSLRKSKRRRGTTPAEIDQVLISPAVLQSQQNGYPPLTSTQSRHKHQKSKSRSSELKLDITTNGQANGNPVRAIKTRVIDWEIPRKLLHSSIGPSHTSSPFPY
jgi:hypothetical protein